ncbi:MAG: M56 family metallopeptidase [Terracidiphilus sp.]|jgi:beta-lactamase regulating signal transducer with metallopeptidase domain
MIPVLIEAALRALLVAFAVWSGLRLLRVSYVLAQKAAWGLVLAAALAMPLVMRWQWLPASAAISLPAHPWAQTVDRWLAGPSRPSTAPLPEASRTREPVLATGDRFPKPWVSHSDFNPSNPADQEPAPFPRSLTAAVPEKSSPFGSLRSFRLATVAWLLYLGVCAALLLRLLFGLGLAFRLWRRAEPASIKPGSGLGSELMTGMNLRVSRRIASPVTIGSGVILPADYTEWDAEKLRIVLAHERSHIRQGDFYLQAFAEFYISLFWFSPLGWWLKRKLSELGEIISDRAGLEEAASRSSYAQVLLEFAALPRPTLIGVAMASSSNLCHRIERFLNEPSFRRAFAGSRRRILLAVLLVPVALFAGTALIRVEAAASGRTLQLPQAVSTAPTPAPAPATVPSMPEQPADQALATEQAPVPPLPEAAPAPAPATPPAPPQTGEIRDAPDDHAAATTSMQDNTVTKTITRTNTGTYTYTSGKHGPSTFSTGRGYSYSFSSNGDSWALVTDPGQSITFAGDWNGATSAAIAQVRKLTHGAYLWFARDGKSYFLDDPAIVAQIEALYKPMEALGRQQEELGRQQEELGKQQEKLGRQQELTRIPTPDLSKEMAEVNAAMAKLQAKMGSTVSQEELADLEGKIGEIQGRLGDLQGKIGAQQGNLGALQGRLGEQEGKLGAEQGRLGAEQGKLAAEADRKVRAIIDESLRNGKARPVE